MFTTVLQSHQSDLDWSGVPIYDVEANLMAKANMSGQITRYYICGAVLTVMLS